MNEQNLSIYIHIPFCERKCKYCDFTSFQNCQDKLDLYVDYLCKEIVREKNKDVIIQSVYIGGGTPSLLSAAHLESIFTALKSAFVIEDNAEITIEVNPNSVTKQKLLIYKTFGINRISVGVQSLNNKVLNSLGRLHNAKMAKEAIDDILSAKFSNISADIMLGVPNQTKNMVKHDINYLCKKVSHISAYQLMLEENTTLYKEVQSGKTKLPSEKQTISISEFAYKLLDKKGFKRYEVSSFCKHGFQSRHNLKYWDGSNYIGFGVSAHSLMGQQRYSNPISLKEYFEMVSANDMTPFRNVEELSIEERKEEFIMLSLRTVKGLNLKEYQARFNEDLYKIKNKEIEKLISLKLINLKEGTISLTSQGFMLLNQVTLNLLP